MTIFEHLGGSENAAPTESMKMGRWVVKEIGWVQYSVLPVACVTTDSGRSAVILIAGRSTKS